MTNSPPPDPRSSQREPLGFDEFIGIFVALTTIGAILFWSISQRNQGFNLTSFLPLSRSPSAQPTVTPLPEATVREGAPEVPVPIPTQSPEVLSPVPSRTPIREQFPVLIPFPTTTPATRLSPTPLSQGTPTPAQPINFVDVPQDFWARPFIQALAARGVVSGFAGDYFRPDRPVTRAEFAALLQDAFDQYPGQSATEYKDVSSDFWGVRAIDRATRAGFLTGYPGNIFRPEQQIPRAQVLVALASGLNLVPPSSPTQVLQTYNDAGQIPNYATQQVAAATNAGLVVNYPNPNLLNPNQNATRAEVAAIIHQALVQAGKVEPIQSQYIVRPNR